MICVRCGGPKRADDTIVQDPLYHGTFPHAPAELCLDCWEASKYVFQNKENRRSWAFWLIAHGYTQKEAALRVGCTSRTIRTWLKSAKSSTTIRRIVSSFGSF